MKRSFEWLWDGGVSYLHVEWPAEGKPRLEEFVEQVLPGLDKPSAADVHARVSEVWGSQPWKGPTDLRAMRAPRYDQIAARIEGARYRGGRQRTPDEGGIMAHPNADFVRKGVEAMIAGDMATVSEMIADDAKFHWPGTSRVSGDIEGKEAILESLAVMPEDITSWQSELHAVLADDEHAVVLLKNTAVRGGETFLLDVVQVFHIADGKLTEGWGTPVDRAVFEAVWA